VNAALDRFEFASASQSLYRFFWSEFCDWGLEMEKERLRSDDEPERSDAAQVLAWVLERTLRLLHPVMPFVTEEIWQRFGIGDTIVTAPWPDADAFEAHGSLGADTEAAWPFVEELVTSIRRFRSEHGIPPRGALELLLVEGDEGSALRDATLGDFRQEVTRLAALSRIGTADPGGTAGAARLVVGGETVLLLVGDLLDLDAERARLRARLETADADLRRAEDKLANPGFREKAPEEVVLAEKHKVERFEREAASLREQLAELG